MPIGAIIALLASLSWAVSSIINTARSGKFSTDRTMQEYNQEIWKLKPIPLPPITK